LPFYLSFRSVAEESAFLAVAFAVAVASEIGPGFSLDITGLPKNWALAPGMCSRNPVRRARKKSRPRIVAAGSFE
jgi:hypothetical protein